MKKITKSMISDFILGVVLMLLTLFAFLLAWGALETLENGLYDLRANLRVTSSKAPVAVIAIDEQSIANLGRWPWPRAHIASMVELLQSYQVKVIGLDIIYSEKDVNQGLVEVRGLIRSIEGEPAPAEPPAAAETTPAPPKKNMAQSKPSPPRQGLEDVLTSLKGKKARQRHDSGQCDCRR